MKWADWMFYWTEDGISAESCSGVSGVGFAYCCTCWSAFEQWLGVFELNSVKCLQPAKLFVIYTSLQSMPLQKKTLLERLKKRLVLLEADNRIWVKCLGFFTVCLGFRRLLAMKCEVKGWSIAWTNIIPPNNTQTTMTTMLVPNYYDCDYPVSVDATNADGLWTHINRFSVLVLVVLQHYNAALFPLFSQSINHLNVKINVTFYRNCLGPAFANTQHMAHTATEAIPSSTRTNTHTHIEFHFSD